MLILVGVTVTVALNGGLFKQARTASIDTQKEADKEQLLTAVVGAIGEDANVNFNELDSNLPNGWTGKNGTYTSPKGNTFTVDENGTIEYTENLSDETTLIAMYRAGENCTEENCTNEKHLHIGDYVEYSPDTTVTTYYPDGKETKNIGAKTGYTTSAGAEELQTVKQEKLNWRVLGAKGDSVLLISGAPTTEGIQFYGHIGYNNYEDILNKACSTLYSKEGIGTANSITMEDIDTYLDGKNYDKSTFDNDGSYSGYYGYTNSKITSKFSYDENENKLTKLEEGTTITLSLTSNAYDYTASDYITDPIKLDILQGSNYYYYWIASRTTYVYFDEAEWCMSEFDGARVFARDGVTTSERDVGGYISCLRPVVSLKSNVSAKSVKKVKTKPEETWNDPLDLY